MMLKLAASALAITAVSGTANSAVQVAGNSVAETCCAAAARQSASGIDLRPCDFALREEALTRHDRIATFVNRGIIRNGTRRATVFRIISSNPAAKIDGSANGA